MKVRPGRLPRTPHFPDGAASLYSLSILDVEGGEMAEMGLDPEAVVKYDRNAKATSHAGVYNFPIRWCDDWHSGVTSKVEAFMHGGFASDWVASWSESTCYPR